MLHHSSNYVLQHKPILIINTLRYIENQYRKHIKPKKPMLLVIAVLSWDIVIMVNKWCIYIVLNLLLYLNHTNIMNIMFIII